MSRLEYGVPSFPGADPENGDHPVHGHERKEEVEAEFFETPGLGLAEMGHDPGIAPDIQAGFVDLEPPDQPVPPGQGIMSEARVFVAETGCDPEFPEILVINEEHLMSGLDRFTDLAEDVEGDLIEILDDGQALFQLLIDAEEMGGIGVAFPEQALQLRDELGHRLPILPKSVAKLKGLLLKPAMGKGLPSR